VSSVQSFTNGTETIEHQVLPHNKWQVTRILLSGIRFVW